MRRSFYNKKAAHIQNQGALSIQGILWRTAVLNDIALVCEHEQDKQHQLISQAAIQVSMTINPTKKSLRQRDGCVNFW